MPHKTHDDDFVLTIEDDDQISDESEAEHSDEAHTATTSKRKREVADDTVLDSSFIFDVEQEVGLEDFDGWHGQQNDRAKSTSTGNGVDIADIVARRQAKRQKTDINESIVKHAKAESDDEDDLSDSKLEDDALFEIEDEDDAAVDGFGGADMEEDHEAGDSDADEEVGQDRADDSSADEQSDVDELSAAKPVAHPNDDIGSQSDDSDIDAEEQRRQNEFFEQDPGMEKSAHSSENMSFVNFSLSRPILKGLTSLGFTAPTPIQAKTIPVALMGKDVVGGAVTGSGKTAAFLIPILERLLFRQKKVAITRVVILMPTRELALQCYNVGKKLAAFSDITFAQAIGGLNSREQEKELKKRPDIVVATPGRFIDFMRNSSSFAVDTIEILVLDEADRMLEDGFADELNEILTSIPKSRQTMLFSATMTSKVDDLIRIGMQRPVRIMVDALKSSAAGLVQEFVRLRPGREDRRIGYLLHLCKQIHTERVIIFFRQKKEAHRVCIIFALCGLKAAELHGSMTQEQRIRAIESFRSGAASFLLATDLASRGLDIKGIETVINYEAPQSHEIYVHRVGRTARAGRTGKACTIAAEPDRKVVKAAVKAAKKQNAKVQQRSVDPQDADIWAKKVEDLKDEIEAVMQEEQEERVLQSTERDLSRVDNFVKHENEIMARPKKTWFQNSKEREQSKSKGNVALNGVVSSSTTSGRGGGSKVKLSNKKKKQLQNKDDRKAGLEWKKGKADRLAGAGKGKPTSKNAKGASKKTPKPRSK